MPEKNIFSPQPEWPPKYSLRRSGKAKRCLLRLLPGKGLEVVLPPRVPEEVAEQMIAAHKDWILSKQAILAQREASTREACANLPQELVLRGGALRLPIEWSPKPQLFVFPEVQEGTDGATKACCRLFARGPGAEHRRRALLHWVLRYAGVFLPPFLAKTAQTYGLEYKQARVKWQKSRLGSCSSLGNINLNARLVFYPDAMIEAVLLHELCHTRHMNHSAKFHEFFRSLNPEAARLDRLLPRERHWVPLWA